jgi:hypothetical protein
MSKLPSFKECITQNLDKKSCVVKYGDNALSFDIIAAGNIIHIYKVIISSHDCNVRTKKGEELLYDIEKDVINQDIFVYNGSDFNFIGDNLKMFFDKTPSNECAKCAHGKEFDECEYCAMIDEDSCEIYDKTTYIKLGYEDFNLNNHDYFESQSANYRSQISGSTHFSRLDWMNKFALSKLKGHYNLGYYVAMLENKIKNLEEKIIELELRPPGVGGELFNQAKEHFDVLSESDK